MTMEDPVRVGTTIRTFRELVGISQQTLASRIHISTQHLANIEAGRRRCKPQHAGNIAKELGISVNAIISDPDD